MIRPVTPVPPSARTENGPPLLRAVQRWSGAVVCHRASPPHSLLFPWCTPVLKSLFATRWEQNNSLCIHLVRWNPTRIDSFPQAAWSFTPNSLCQLVKSWLTWAFPTSTLANGLLGTSENPEAWQLTGERASPEVLGTSALQRNSCLSRRFCLAENQERPDQKPSWNVLASCCSLRCFVDTDLERQPGGCCVKSGFPTQPRAYCYLWAAAERYSVYGNRGEARLWG